MSGLWNEQSFRRAAPSGLQELFFLSSTAHHSPAFWSGIPVAACDRQESAECFIQRACNDWTPCFDHCSLHSKNGPFFSRHRSYGLQPTLPCRSYIHFLHRMTEMNKSRLLNQQVIAGILYIFQVHITTAALIVAF